MDDFRLPETSNIVPQPVKKVLLFDDFKSIYYQLNAKPDTEIRLLRGKKVLELSDIRSINEQISAKLENHEVDMNMLSIDIILSNGKIKDYSNWTEFLRENWDTINERVGSFIIKWDILIRLSQYNLPQRHTIKLRIGNAIPPKEIFQLILTSDDMPEIIESRSPSVCKVDFINDIIANELLNIVSSWHKGLKSSPEASFAKKFIEKRGKLLTEIIRSVSPIIFLVTSYLYSSFLFPFFGIEGELSIDNVCKISILLVSFFWTGAFAGRKIEKFIDKLIDKLEDYPSFSITRGDKKAISDFEMNNKKLVQQIVNRTLWILFSLLVSSFLKLVMPYLIFLGKSR